MSAKSSRVTLVDYGVGNLFSVNTALSLCGAEVRVTDNPREVSSAERLLLPGVGAFANGMQELSKRGLVDAVMEFVQTSRPFLGICLGMQMMLDLSEEFGNSKGLQLVPGKVVGIPPTGTDGRPHKIPHIGWNAINRPVGQSWEEGILKGIRSGQPYYFVHSYMAQPSNPQYQHAVCNYNGRIISAVIRKGNLHGCQFHPEKSGSAGLKLLTNFCEI